jgi:hypothetical protein
MGAGPPLPADHDADGVWDSDDACPDQPGPSRPDPGQSGCPDKPAAGTGEAEAVIAPLDGDGDGVPDASDACPKQRGVASNDAELNGCPQQADTDGDGVPDVEDACPKEPGPRSSDPKTSGCAAKVDSSKLKDKAEITLSGYRALPGNRGLLFVELSDPVAVEVSRSGQVIEYKLVGATVPLRNNKNPLLLSDFSGSAVSARLVPDKSTLVERGRTKHVPAVRLVVTLRGNVSPLHRMVLRPQGAALEVELPATPNP